MNHRPKVRKVIIWCISAKKFDPVLSIKNIIKLLMLNTQGIWYRLLCVARLFQAIISKTIIHYCKKKKLTVNEYNGCCSFTLVKKVNERILSRKKDLKYHMYLFNEINKNNDNSCLLKINFRETVYFKTIYKSIQ